MIGIIDSLLSKTHGALKMIGRFFLSLFFLSFLFVNPVFAVEKILLESSVNKSLITESETVVYTVKVSAEDRNAFNELILPDFSKHFAVLERRQGSSFRMINGIVSQSQTRTFRLKPLHLGEIEIPPARLDFKNVMYQSVTSSVQIVTANNNAAGTLENGQLIEKNPDIFIETKLSKNTVFVGEPVTYDLVMYRRMQLWGQVHYSVPTFEGFWPEAVGKPGDFDTEINGKRYYVTPIVRIQLFPTEARDFRFDPATVLVQTNVFGARVKLSDEAVTLNVRPLPTQNKPADFSNLVGDFDIGISNGTLPNLKENQPISILVTVSGTGNIQQIQEVDIKNDDNFNVYLSRYVDTYGGARNTVIARTFEYVVLPRVSGVIFFPEFSINYFSPERLAYEVKQTDKFSVRVLPDEALISGEDNYADSAEGVTAGLISTANGLSENHEPILKNGVSAVKKKAYGEAIYAFLKLQKVYPYNDVILHNLERTRGLMTEDIGRGQVRRFYYALSLQVQPILRAGLILSALLGLMGFMYLRLKKKDQWVPAVCITMVSVILFLCMGVLFSGFGKSIVDGVVMPTKIALKSGPSLALDTKVIIYSGTVVNVLAKRNGFTKVALENDIEGWLDETALRYFD